MRAYPADLDYARMETGKMSQLFVNANSYVNREKA
jgi:hypothetical protein